MIFFYGKLIDVVVIKRNILIAIIVYTKDFGI